MQLQINLCLLLHVFGSCNKYIKSQKLTEILSYKHFFLSFSASSCVVLLLNYQPITIHQARKSALKYFEELQNFNQYWGPTVCKKDGSSEIVSRCKFKCNFKMILASLCNIFKAVWYGLQSASPIEHIVKVFTKKNYQLIKWKSAGQMKLFYHIGTLESGINVALQLLFFWLFSRGYGLILDFIV